MENGVVSVLVVCVLLAFKIDEGSGCSKDEYSCFDRTQCIHWSYFCDGNRDCRDGSDEIVYDNQDERGGIECDANDINGRDKKCLLPSKYICDGMSHCIDESDECLCNINEERKELLNEKCFLCLNHPTIIKFGNLCDGIFHCPDLSDECICRKRGPPPEICNHVDWARYCLRLYVITFNISGT
ncbi:uncharacterized protein LOC144424241 [Styela clava]